MSEKIHYTRPPKLSELKSAIANGAKIFRMPRSCFVRLSTSARKLLDSADADIVIESARGRPLNINMEKLVEIVELHRDHRTFRQIEEITGIPKSTVHYLIKYAERQKIKGKNGVVYL